MKTDTYFCDNGRILCINTHHAERPLWNYFVNREYHSKFSQTAQGTSFAFAPREKTVTRDYRYFYIKNNSTGRCYNPNYLPLNEEPDKYCCMHKPGFSEIVSETDGIETSIRFFVPLEGKREFWKISLKNNSGAEARLDLFPMFTVNTPGMGSRCSFDREARMFICYAFPYHVRYAEYEDKNGEDNYRYVLCSDMPDSYDCGELRFFGSDNHVEIPAALRRGRCSDTISENDAPIAAPHNSVLLEPGEEREFVYVLGCAADIESVKKDLCTADVKVWAKEEFERTNAFWKAAGERVVIDSPDEELNRMMNCWLPKQVVSMNLTHRFEELSCVRNELQDALGYSVMNPDAALEFLKKVFRLQEPDGNLKQWHIVNNTSPIRRLGLLTYYDGPAWLIICACVILKRYGEKELLDEAVEFNGGAAADIYEHIMRAVKFLDKKRGAHGLVLFADGDWTDPLNGMGGEGKGETTWGSEAFLYGIKLFRELALLKARAEDAEYLEKLAAELHIAINDNCWDGEWYALGFNDRGEKVGVSTDTEGKIFLNAQTWAVISGAAEGERLEKTLKAVESIDTPCGPAVNHPAFSGWNSNIGRASLKLSGTTENGAVYCHAVMFAAYAYCIAGDYSRAYEMIEKTMPENRLNPTEKNLQAPIFVPNYYYGLTDSPNFGISSNVYSTGTADWMMWVVEEQIFGLCSDFDGIRIAPHFPDKWERAGIRKIYKNAVYNIEIVRGGDKSITVDDKPLDGNLLPYCENHSYKVKVTI